MEMFVIVPIDPYEEKYRIERWNEVKKQYEPIGRTYPSKELAEIAKQGMEDMYNEENQKQ
jgi:hypothetical protein